MNFAGKVAVITGGAKGIGKCMTQEFTRAGARVAVIDLEPDPVDCDLYFRGDIAREQVLQEFVSQVIGRYGGIDYLINNAGLSRQGILSDCSYADFNYVLQVGVTAPYMLTRLFRSYFRKGGAVVNISSTRAFMSQPDTESYTAAKGGITALTHALAVSLAGDVRVNCISPGWIDTTGSTWSAEDQEQHPVKRIGHPLDIARMAMFLCSEDSGFMTGQNVTVDGGMSRQMIYHNDHGWRYKKEGHEI